MKDAYATKNDQNDSLKSSGLKLDLQKDTVTFITGEGVLRKVAKAQQYTKFRMESASVMFK